MPFHMTYYFKKVPWIVHTPQEYSGGILGWLENWQAGGEQVSSSFCSDWASTPTTKNCSAVLQQQHKWWLPFDLRCLEGKVKQTWITINNVRSDFLKNNMKTPPFNLHQQFLLALCTMSRLWCIPSTCLKRWRGKSFCSLSCYLRIVIHFISKAFIHNGSYLHMSRSQLAFSL